MTRLRKPVGAARLVRISERISFLYLERCAIHRDAYAITATDEAGTVHIPASSLAVLLLGPGTRITHAGISLLSESGVTTVWVGESTVRYYAHAMPLSKGTRLLVAQARAVSSPRSRLAIAKKMYALRFPGEDLTGVTMRQLRGREGARVRSLYREWSKKTGVPWTKRDYKPDDFFDSDLINQALSAANHTLYGIIQAVVTSLGCSPGLGFIHTGHQRSFVYDIADIFKAEFTIPVAFETCAADPFSTDIATQVRQNLRDVVFEKKLLQNAVQTLVNLLLPDLEDIDSLVDDDSNVVHLWSNEPSPLPSGRNYQ